MAAKPKLTLQCPKLSLSYLQWCQNCHMFRKDKEQHCVKFWMRHLKILQFLQLYNTCRVAFIMAKVCEKDSHKCSFSAGTRIATRLFISKFAESVTFLISCVGVSDVRFLKPVVFRLI